MTTSPEVKELFAALAVAQGAIEGATKDSDNPFFKSKYADLASVWGACRAHLATNGLSVVQMPGDFLLGDQGATMTLTTRLCHSSGQWIEETMTVPVKQQDAQGAVAAITYARRASLAAFVGVAPIDDDGEEAVGRGAATPSASAGKGIPAAPPRPKTTPKLSKMENLKVLETSYLTALVNGQFVDALVLKDTPQGLAAKAALRAQLRCSVGEPSTEEALEVWVQALAKMRDQNIPHDLLA